MAQHPRNAGKPWTSEDEDKLKGLAGGDTPLRIIALELGRTEDAVRAKARGLGLSPGPTHRRRTTAGRNEA